MAVKDLLVRFRAEYPTLVYYGANNEYVYMSGASNAIRVFQLGQRVLVKSVWANMKMIDVGGTNEFPAQNWSFDFSLQSDYSIGVDANAFLASKGTTSPADFELTDKIPAIDFSPLKLIIDAISLDAQVWMRIPDNPATVGNTGVIDMYMQVEVVNDTIGN